MRLVAAAIHMIAHTAQRVRFLGLQPCHASKAKRPPKSLGKIGAVQDYKLHLVDIFVLHRQ